MEALVKKYFWCVNLLFLFFAALLVSGMVNIVVAHKLRALPSISKKPETTYQPQGLVKKTSDNTLIVDLNLFGSDMAAKLESPLTGPDLEKNADMTGEGVESSLNAALIGTIVADTSDWSMAVIIDQNISETGIFRVGDELMGESMIMAIQSRRVVVNHNGVKEYLELQEKAQPKVASRYNPHHAVARRTSGSSMEGVQQIGENSYRIERAEIDKTLSNLNSIAMQARIVPSFKDGKSNGFKLFAIRPGSVYSKLGIKNGDVIHKINGYPMDSPEKALEIYQKLKTARNVEIELSRRNNMQKLKYQIE